MKDFIRLEHVSKIYGDKDDRICALDDISLTIGQGEFV